MHFSQTPVYRTAIFVNFMKKKLMAADQFDELEIQKLKDTVATSLTKLIETR